MKLKDTSPAAIVSGGETKEYTLKATAKAFKIISQQIYTNPKLAVVRELACNQWDAHQMNGNTDTPFYIHLPTLLEPYLVFRDYGVGMSKETIDNVYTVVFESTKENDARQTGALGLGSKTPFAYDRDQAFTVTSWYDGVKTTYSVFMDAGIPKVIELSSEQSDEPSGVEIVVPIHEEDFAEIKKAAIRSTYVMKNPSPSFNIEVNLPKPTAEYDGFSLYEGDRSIVAEMCNVVYPIKKSELKNTKDYDIIIKMLPYGSNAQYCMVHFDSGELDFQASREELYYDNHYVEVIEAKLKEVADKFISEIQKKVDEQDLSTWRHVYTYSADVLKMSVEVTMRLKFNGVTLETHANYHDSGLIQISESIPTMGFCSVNYELCAGRLTRVRGSGRSRLMNQHAIDYLPNRGLMNPQSFIINDLGFKGRSYIKQFMNDNNLRYAWLIEKDKSLDNTIFAEILIKMLHEDEIKAIGVTSKVKEDLAKRPKEKRVAAVRSKPVEVFEYKDRSKFTTNVTEEFLKTGTYFYTGYYKDYCDNEGTKLTRTYGGCDYTDSIIINFVADVLGVEEVYAIRRSKLKLATQNPNAINISNPNIVKKVLDSVDIPSLAMLEGSEYGYGSTKEYLAVVQELPCNYDILVRRFLTNNSKISNKVVQYLKAKETERVEIKEKYPLIMHCKTPSFAKEYMKMVDFYNEHHKENK